MEAVVRARTRPPPLSSHEQAHAAVDVGAAGAHAVDLLDGAGRQHLGRRAVRHDAPPPRPRLMSTTRSQ